MCLHIFPFELISTTAAEAKSEPLFLQVVMHWCIRLRAGCEWMKPGITSMKQGTRILVISAHSTSRLVEVAVQFAALKLLWDCMRMPPSWWTPITQISVSYRTAFEWTYMILVLLVHHRSTIKRCILHTSLAYRIRRLFNLEAKAVIKSRQLQISGDCETQGGKNN